MRGELELAGQRFGELVALRKAGHSGNGRLWLCRCDCGRERVILACNVRRARSCGCARSGGSAHTHGLSGHPLYCVWRSMVERCRNPNRPKYRYYGGRGIGVCERWLGREGFPNFLADVGERPEGTTLDRIDNDGDYEPGNVRWATAREQNANRSQRRPDEDLAQRAA